MTLCALLGSATGIHGELWGMDDARPGVEGGALFEREAFRAGRGHEGRM